jgi:hypothetical protein
MTIRDMSNGSGGSDFRLRFSLRTVFLAMFAIAVVAAGIRTWSCRDLAVIDEIIGQAMPVVDGIDCYDRLHAGYPKTLDAAGIITPEQRRGWFDPNLFDYRPYGKHYHYYYLEFFLPRYNEYLTWDSQSREWYTTGRSPTEVRWSEEHVRRRLRAKGTGAKE